VTFVEAKRRVEKAQREVLFRARRYTMASSEPLHSTCAVELHRAAWALRDADVLLIAVAARDMAPREPKKGARGVGGKVGTRGSKWKRALRRG